MDSKKRDVFWLIILRLIILTALLISAISIQFSTSTFLPLNAFYYVIITAYALSLLYLALYFWDHHYIFQAGIQIFFDLFWITAVVYISGGVRGSFYFLYIFAIIAASVVISNRAAYLTACLSAVLFGLLTNGIFLGLIPNYGADINEEISLGIVINNIIIAGCVFVLVAFLINYVSSNLRRTRKALEMTQREL